METWNYQNSYQQPSFNPEHQQEQEEQQDDEEQNIIKVEDLNANTETCCDFLIYPRKRTQKKRFHIIIFVPLFFLDLVIEIFFFQNIFVKVIFFFSFFLH